MIIIKLSGGLGNQMFQYACGLQIASYHNVPLLLDMNYIESRSPRENFTFREFGLNIFPIIYQRADDDILRKYYRIDIISRIKRKFKLINIIQEEGRTYNNKISNSTKECYLIGYWQSEKYFINVAEQIRTDFTFPQKLENSYIEEIIEKIQTSNSVSIHIRRGDYASNKHTNNLFGVLSKEYYHKAIEFIKNIENALTIFIFSDDIKWVKNNFKLESNIVIVEHKQSVSDYVDMKLMSYCKHNIIANSSYSWWGAWLNSNPDKIVIAPKNWYASVKNEDILKDRIPPKWIVF